MLGAAMRPLGFAQRGAVDVQAAGRLERALMIVQRLGVDVEAV